MRQILGRARCLARASLPRTGSSNAPSTMTAMRVNVVGGPSQMQLESVPVPWDVAPGFVLVRNAFSGVSSQSDRKLS
jgi:hypothetical protein